MKKLKFKLQCPKCRKAPTREYGWTWADELPGRYEIGYYSYRCVPCDLTVYDPFQEIVEITPLEEGK